VALVAFAGPAFAQVQLAWKFKEGDRFYVEERSVNKQTLSFAAQKIEQQNVSRTVTEFTVRSRNQGGVVLEQKILHWRSTQTDNGAAKPENKLIEDIAKDVVFSFRLTPDGQIKEFTGADTALKNAQQNFPNEAAALKAINLPGLLEASVRMTFAVAPDKKVKMGDTWKLEQLIPVGPIGTIQMSNTYTYKGKEGEVEKIALEGTFVYQLPKVSDEAALGFKIIKGELKPKNPIKGTATFNATTGRLVQSEHATEMAGTITFEVQGNQIEAMLDSVETRTTRLTTANPLKQ